MSDKHMDLFLTQQIESPLCQCMCLHGYLIGQPEARVIN